MPISESVTIPTNILIGVVVAVIVVIVITMYKSRDTNNYAKFIDGAFIGDSEYCKSAEISSMIIVLTAPIDGVIEGHILINNDVCNQSMTIKIKKECNMGNSIYEITGDVEFEEDPVFDTSNVKFRFNLATGQLRVYKNGELYGLLYRDNQTSAQEYD